MTRHLTEQDLADLEGLVADNPHDDHWTRWRCAEVRREFERGELTRNGLAFLLALVEMVEATAPLLERLPRLWYRWRIKRRLRAEMRFAPA